MLEICVLLTLITQPLHLASVSGMLSSTYLLEFFGDNALVTRNFSLHRGSRAALFPRKVDLELLVLLVDSVSADYRRGSLLSLVHLDNLTAKVVFGLTLSGQILQEIK